MEGFLDNFLGLLKQAMYIVPVIFISLTVHECAHGYVAYKLGDRTAKSMGRLTLNPIAHLDPMGTVMLLISSLSGFGFGWAKPVPINPMYFRNRKLGMVLSSIAGPLSNFLLALISLILLVVVQGLFFTEEMFMSIAMGKINFALIFYNFMETLIGVNIGLCVFNLLPFPPLDGSKIISGFLPEEWYFKLMDYENYIGMIFVFIIIFKGEWVDLLLNPLFVKVYELLVYIVTPIMNLFV